MVNPDGNELLAKVKGVDEKISYLVYKLCSERRTSTTSYGTINNLDAAIKFFEYSCHILTMVVLIVTSLCMWPESNLLAQIMVGLIFDCFVVAVVKAYSRRKSPPYGSQDAAEKQSFPSGQASRAIYLALSLSTGFFSSLLLWTWATCILLSRVMTGKHFVGDVLAGIGIGYLEYALQFGFGKPIFTFLVWLLKSSLALPFDNTNDMSVDAEVGPDFDVD